MPTPRPAAAAAMTTMMMVGMRSFKRSTTLKRLDLKIPLNG